MQLKENNKAKELIIKHQILAENASASSCPGRISFSKHCDYINNDLLYIADDRAIISVCEFIKDESNEAFGKLTLINENPNFRNQSYDLKELSLNAEDSWDFYIRKLLKLIYERYLNKIKENHFRFSNHGIKLIYSSNLPEASGLSSSHALILSTFLNLNKQYGLEINEETEIIKLCQEVEHARGFKSGLGDQAAQLLAKRDKFLFLKLHRSLSYSYIDIPKDLTIISAPSFIKAEKSSPEFNDANIKIAAYKLSNLIFGNLSQRLFLGDMLYQYPEKEIFQKLKELRDDMGIEEIIRLTLKYQFDDSQEGSKNEDKIRNAVSEIIRTAKIEKIPSTWPIKAVTLYGLAEGARLKELKENFSIEKLGKHLNMSHEAERNFNSKDGEYKQIPKKEKTYIFDESKKLSDHIGLYSASTKENDELQDICLKLGGKIYGSSISGAGLGGNNLILAKKEFAEEIIETLIKEFYEKNNLIENDKDLYQALHIVKSVDGARLIKI